MEIPKVKTKDEVRRELLEKKIQEMTTAEACWSSARASWEKGDESTARVQEARAQAAECSACVIEAHIELLVLSAD